jgi:DNA-binding CsgD family transcriptional regulator
MGKAASWREKTYSPQQALTLSSRLYVLLRDELGLGRQPKVARLLANEILKVVEETLVNADTLRPGQLLVLAPEIGQGASWSRGKLEEKRLKAIRLSLIEADDINRLAAGERPYLVRRQRLVRVIRQAHEQGAVLSSAQLAIIFGYSAASIGVHLKAHKKATGEVLPTRGIVEDIGKGTTHKKQIVARHLNGESTSEIARATNHTPRSVERYIRRFEQVRELVSHIGDSDPVVVARILDCSQQLVAEYLDLIPRRGKR